MAGGTFITQNKKRAGAYLNMIAVKRNSASVGDRGTVAIPVSLSWGEEGKITRVTFEDYMLGNTVSEIGVDYNDNDDVAIQLAFTGATTLLLYRVNTNGVKASADVGDLEVEAKYSGTFGNKISVSVVANGSKFDVITTVDGKIKDKQTVSEIADLKANDYVEFDGTGDLAANAGTLLTGGTNGTIGATAYTNFLAALDSYNFNCLAMPSETSSDITATISKVQGFRSQGKYVQGVVIDTQTNDEGIITFKQKLKINGNEVSKANMTIYIAAITAGAAVNKSNTYRVVEGATEIVDELSNAEIEEYLGKGYFLFSARQDGAIVVEQDINTLHEYDDTKSYAFSKNRVIRTLDEIARTICLDFEMNYIGKVTNNETGRNLFKSSLLNILDQFTNLECIESVNPQEVEVLAGEDIDSVVVNMAVKPNDSMEKLYVTMLVR